MSYGKDITNTPKGHDLELRKKVAALEWERIKRIQDGFAFQEEAEKVAEWNDEEFLLQNFIPELNAKLDDLEIPEMRSAKYKEVIRVFIDNVAKIKSIKPTVKLKDTIDKLNGHLK